MSTLRLERRRAERSRKPFLLMLVEGNHLFETDKKVLQGVIAGLSSSMRETDIHGWYEEHSILGVIFTEIGEADRNSILQMMRGKMLAALQNRLNPQHLAQISLSFHFYPEHWSGDGQRLSADTKLFPDLSQRDASRKLARSLKRAMDLVGSVVALTVFSPLFLLIALLIKLSSKGPVLFRQRRVGQHSVPFTFLKFRTMKVENDPSIHKEYVKRFIAGRVDAEQGNENGNGVYKITDDPRVTRIGTFLRKSSLDELPQFLNVFKGQMSLVGPRPPIPYELESYDIWHRRRVLEAKPGITGLWQVSGRSKIKFDDMVRRDLQYAQSWSLWLDIKILLQTPRAVFSGEGAW